MIDAKTAIEEIRKGKLVILVDDENRENEGDMVVATEKLTPEIVNFMAKEGRGLICISLPYKRIQRLRMEPMCSVNTSVHGTAFCVSCEVKEGITTGISAFDRCLTMKKLIEEGARVEDFIFPGHVFPIVARDGGVMERAGHTEASADLAALAGLKPSGVVVEIMDDDGRMARMDKLEMMAKKFDIGVASIESIVEYRQEKGLLGSLYQEW